MDMKIHNFLVIANALVDRGFRVFPLLENGKTPVIKSFPTQATTDAKRIWSWNRNGPDRNVGVSTTLSPKYGALLVIDVDNKDGRAGSDTILQLEKDGFVIPETFTVLTPTGGYHYYLSAPYPITQGTNLFPGVDTRSFHGYVVGPGSIINGVAYTIEKDVPVAAAPQWLLDRVQRAPDKPAKEKKTPKEPKDKSDSIRTKSGKLSAKGKRVIEWVENYAPAGTPGDRNTNGFKVAAYLKDQNISPEEILDIMMEHWDCTPPAPEEDIQKIINNAFHYGQNEVGSNDAVTAFADVPLPPKAKKALEKKKAKAAAAASPAPAQASEAVTPVTDEQSDASDDASDDAPQAGVCGDSNDEEVDKDHFRIEMNKRYAYLIEGDAIIEEVIVDGRMQLRRMKMPNFHNFLANRKYTDGKRKIKMSVDWMDWSGRRSFDRVVFKPGGNVAMGEYNIWYGFAVKPARTALHPAVDKLMEHIEKNACKGDKELAKWVIGFFAQLVQEPHKKPRVALVFKGGKGVGKSIIAEIMAMLLKPYALIASNPRYLTSNFNSHFENCLLFVADEASWGGDKKHEGSLKDLITGSRHNIERKGFETTTVDNLTRVIIIGNEKWLVPATEGERRFTVLDFGTKNQQDDVFFGEIMDGMRLNGGLEALLRYLLDFDLSTVNINKAFVTDGLLEQKLATVETCVKWWHECLTEDFLVGGTFSTDVNRLPDRIPTNRFEDAFHTWARTRKLDRYLPTKRELRDSLKAISPVFMKERDNGKRDIGDAKRAYFNPGIEVLRREFSAFIGHSIVWESENND